MSRMNEFLHSKKHRSCAQIDISYFFFYLPNCADKKIEKKTLESLQYAKHISKNLIQNIIKIQVPTYLKG